MTWEAEALALIKATAERLSTESPFERSQDIAAQIERAIMETAARDTLRLGAHMDAVRVHSATLECMRMEMPLHRQRKRGEPMVFYGPANTIEIIEDDSIEPGTIKPEWRRFK